MSADLCDRVRRLVCECERLMRECDECCRHNPGNNPIIRRRFRFARRGLGVARLAFLAILGLLGTAAR